MAEAHERYDGTIVYGANWGEFESMDWWDAVDVIGIDAYFPLSDGDTPSEAEIVRAWHDRWMRRIEAVQARSGKPVLFPEIGYSSRSRALVDPWFAAGTPYSAADQERALGALFSAFADKPWFRGVYLWQWNADPGFGGFGDRDHTPQDKPAEALFAQRWWASCARVSGSNRLTQPAVAPASPPPAPGPAPTAAPKPAPELAGGQKAETTIRLTSVRVAPRRRIRIAGRVRGARAGNVELRVRRVGPGRRHGERVTRPLRPDGRFFAVVQVPPRGRYVIRAAFLGGATATGSTAPPRTVRLPH